MPIARICLFHLKEPIKLFSKLFFGYLLSCISVRLQDEVHANYVTIHNDLTQIDRSLHCTKPLYNLANEKRTEKTVYLITSQVLSNGTINLILD